MQLSLCLVVWGFCFSKGKPTIPLWASKCFFSCCFQQRGVASPAQLWCHGMPSMDAVAPLNPQKREELSLFCLHSKHRQVFGGSVFIQVFGKAQSVPAMAPGGSGPGFLSWTQHNLKQLWVALARGICTLPLPGWNFGSCAQRFWHRWGAELRDNGRDSFFILAWTQSSHLWSQGGVSTKLLLNYPGKKLPNFEVNPLENTEARSPEGKQTASAQLMCLISRIYHLALLLFRMCPLAPSLVALWPQVQSHRGDERL